MAACQTITPLTLGELWAIAIMHAPRAERENERAARSVHDIRPYLPHMP